MSATERSRNSRPSRKDTWPTPGTMLFTGADLDDAVAAAMDELGSEVDVVAARSVKQGLRGKTHVEVLVAASEGDFVPPLPPSERTGDDPVESTLAALLASAEAEEQEFQRTTAAGRSVAADRSSVIPFDPPQLAGNPTFAAEFAAAFPAALAAAKAAEEPEPRLGPVERSALVPASAIVPVDDFTARVREALRRVPQEDSADEAGTPAGIADGSADTEELEIVRPTHPAIDLIDEPPFSRPTPPLTAIPLTPATPLTQARPRPTPSVDGVRRARPSPGPSAMSGRPAVLRRPAGSGWSGARLRELGVPDAVLDAMPAEEPADDLRWLVALTDAITATVPEPAEDGSADVTASGTGLRGALALLRLGVEGVPPHTLTVDGRALPATATELALAVRAGILR